MKPQDTQQFRRNRYYKSAVHAAVEYPDLAMLMWEGGKSGSHGVEGTDSLLPGTKQVRPPQPRPGLESWLLWPSLSTATAETSLGRGIVISVWRLLAHSTLKLCQALCSCNCSCSHLQSLQACAMSAHIQPGSADPVGNLQLTHNASHGIANSPVMCRPRRCAVWRSCSRPVLP